MYEVLYSESYYFYGFSTSTEYMVDWSKEPRKTYELHYLEGGGYCEFTLKEQSFVLKSGQMMYIPPETSYKLVIKTDEGEVCNGRVLCFRFFPGILAYDFPPQIIIPNSLLLDYLAQVPVHSKQIDCLFMFKTYQFLNEFQLHLKKANTKYVAVLQPALDYMNEHDDYSIAQLAKLCNISEPYFYIIFKKGLGMSPVQMKHSLQATKAEQLLRTTNLSVEEIAERVGFSSASHFRSVFRKRFGCSPHDIRKKARLGSGSK